MHRKHLCYNYINHKVKYQNIFFFYRLESIFAEDTEIKFLGELIGPTAFGKNLVSMNYLNEYLNMGQNTKLPEFQCHLQFIMMDGNLNLNVSKNNAASLFACMLQSSEKVNMIVYTKSVVTLYPDCGPQSKCSAICS